MTSKTILAIVFAGALTAQAHAVSAVDAMPGTVPPVTQGDLEAARQSFAIETALEGCWLRKEVPVACGDKAPSGSNCVSIEVKKVPCADEKKPDAKDGKERGA